MSNEIKVSELIAALEKLVDASSVTEVVLALGRVCDEKAEHLIVNWQDKTTAKAWDRTARILDSAARKIDL